MDSMNFRVGFGKVITERDAIIGDLKEHIKEAILDGEIKNDRDEALALLRRIANEKGLEEVRETKDEMRNTDN